MYRPHVSGIMSALIAGVPIRISNVHNLDQWDSIRQIWTDRTVARFCTAIIAVSGAVLSNYTKQTGTPKSKCRIIYNGVDTDRFYPMEPDEAVYRSVDLHRDDCVLGTIGRLVEAKDHLLFLESAVEIVKSYPSVKFLIVGDGPRMESLNLFVRENGLEGNVVFTGFRGDVPQLIQICHALVFPSRREGFSNALLESMACGKPVIATSVGGNPEAIINNKTGILIRSGDTENLVAGCMQLIQNPEFSREMGRSAREHVLQHFSLKTMVRKTRELYVELLGHSG
jgi:glycosyltransferase involved in cell wall biosynthesis